jgi:hypothetical protein
LNDEERLALIDCVMYDPNLVNYDPNPDNSETGNDAETSNPVKEPVTLGVWAAEVESLSEDQFNDIRGVYDGRLGGMTYAEFKRVAESVASDTTLSEYVIEDVTDRYVRPVPGVNMSNVIPGRDATFRDPSTGQFVVAFQGTATPGEWVDNGKGGYAGVTDTPDQTAALTYFNRIAGRFGWTGDTDVTTTGHSKGGNLAVYVAVLRPDMVNREFSFSPAASAVCGLVGVGRAAAPRRNASHHPGRPHLASALAGVGRESLRRLPDKSLRPDHGAAPVETSRLSTVSDGPALACYRLATQQYVDSSDERSAMANVNVTFDGIRPAVSCLEAGEPARGKTDPEPDGARFGAV